MSVTLPTFTPQEEGLFLTLYARALDNRRPHPILGDATADQIVRTTDYDYGQLHVDTNLILSVALRAKKLDQVASEFLARQPGRGRARPGRRAGHPIRATGPAVHRGLVRRRLPRGRQRPGAPDPRAPQRPRHRRGRAGPGLAGRRPQRPAGHHRGRRADGVPHPGRAGVAVEPARQPLPQRRDRPQQLHPVRHLDRPPRPRHQVGRRPRQVPRHGRPREPEGWIPKLKLVREILLSREPEVAEFPPFWRTYHRLAAHSTAWSRTGTIVLHYRF
jgi:hypothetical protein